MKTEKLILFAALFCLTLLVACDGFVSRTIIIGVATVTFDPQGGTMVCEDGTAECAEMKAFSGATMILPGAILDGSMLLGWFTAAEGGTNVGSAGHGYVATEDITLYARWAQVVPVGAGKFIMGSHESEPERYFDEVQREVTLTKSYLITRYPITNREFGRTVPAGEEYHPVVNVTWQEAYDFVQKAGGYLPTEAQWEFAARGGASGGPVYSGSNVLADVGWYDGSGVAGPQRVGQKAPNALEIYDMSGNVYEWCYDWYGFHTGEAVTDPTGRESRYETYGRISRGGAWDRPARDARVADRAHSDPETRSDNLGFRILWEVD